MAVLSALVAVLAVVAILDLVLTVGVIRRLRQHEDRFNAPRNDFPERIMLRDGSRVGEFAAVTDDGAEVSRDTFAGTTLVAFMSTHCSTCHVALPKFVEFARTMPGGRDDVLAVIVGHEGEEKVEEYRRALAPVARTVCEIEDGPMGLAFDVQGFPATAFVDAQGVVLTSAYELEDLRVPVAS